MHSGSGGETCSEREVHSHTCRHARTKKERALKRVPEENLENGPGHRDPKRLEKMSILQKAQPTNSETSTTARYVKRTSALRTPRGEGEGEGERFRKQSKKTATYAYTLPCSKKK